MLADDDGQVVFMDVNSLKVLKEFPPLTSSQPYQASVSDDGRWFSVLFHSGAVWLYDADKEAGRWYKSGASCIAFNGNNLMVVDRSARLIEYDLSSGGETRRLEPSMDGTLTVFTYLVKPLYWVFPKPGELENAAQYAVTDQDSAPLGNAQDLRTARIKIDVWGPIWNSLIFEFVMLALTCIYITRADL